jgi:hypothetical protein
VAKAMKDAFQRNGVQAETMELDIDKKGAIVH